MGNGNQAMGNGKREMGNEETRKRGNEETRKDQKHRETLHGMDIRLLT